MNILIDIGHPAHVHLFKHFARAMKKKGHKVLFTCREKEFETYLLKKFGFQFKSFGKKYTSLIGKLWGLIEFDVKEFLAGLSFKPDILLSHGSVYAAHAAFFLRKPHITLEDTGNREQIKLYAPFSSVIMAPASLEAYLGEKQIRYNGYHELAYLHPNYFVPSDEIYEYLHIEEKEKYVIIRFVSWKASHDLGQTGIHEKTKEILIQDLVQKGYKIFISSENELSEKYFHYKINIPPELMHSALYYASLFIGEGATMANESAILGTPAVYVNSRKACIGDLENFEILFHLKNDVELLKLIDKIHKIPDVKTEWRRRRQKMLADKIDVTAFLVWFIENYPQSREMVEDTEEFWGRFR